MIDRETELALVRSLKQGDEAAFDTIYEAYRAQIYSFLVRLVSDRYVAEELLEETWLRLISRASTLADDSRLLPWLFTVARNLFLSYCRSRQMDAKRVQELMHMYTPGADDGLSPFEATAGYELGQILEDALATLPVHHREALLLVGNEGLTPFEAAVICEVSPETLRQRLSRARKHLASKLEEQGIDLLHRRRPSQTKKERERRNA